MANWTSPPTNRPMRATGSALVAGGAVLLLAAGWMGWATKRTSPAAGDEGRTSFPLPGRAIQAKADRPAVPPDLLPPQVSPHASGTAEHEAWLDERTDALIDLSWMEDAGSLDAILAELRNPEPRIREVAIKAAVNFSSRDAIPRLEAAALRADDPAEKKQLEEAAGFLKLPTLTEHLAKQREKAKSR